MDDPELLTSGEVADVLGVGPSTVKRWTDSGELKCVKTLGRHRRFARSEVESFARRNGLAQAAVKRAGTDALTVHPGPPDAIDRWLGLLTGEGTAYDVQAALLTERSARGSWWRVAEFMGQVLAAIGSRWVEGRLSIVQEHLASERLQRGIAMVCESLTIRDSAPSCLLATAENDEHTLGLALLELTLREAGWRTRWAGRNTPVDELVRFIGVDSVKMVALSASSISSDATALAMAAERVGNACRAGNIELVLGGMGAWPEPPLYGYRTRSFAELHQLLEHR